MNRWLGVGGALALAMAAGCGSSQGSGEPIGSKGAAIQGGTDDTTDTFAVGVRNLDLGICSGALIAPNLVATARHCVARAPELIDCATANFGDVSDASQLQITTDAQMTQDGNWRKVKKIVTPDPTPICGNDLALLILEENVPESEAKPVTPVVQYAIYDRTRFSTTNTAIGYGLEDPATHSGSGVRRIRQNIPIVCIPDSPDDDCYTAPSGDPALRDYIKPSEFMTGDGTCQGDSGSSAYEQTNFDNGTPVTFGVLSRGSVSSDGKQCQGGVYTRFDSWKHLVADTAIEAASLGGYTPPAWTNLPPDPPTDGGTDANSVGTLSLGDPCGLNQECASGLCRGLDSENFICTQTCNASNACPDGFTCTSGYCFPGQGSPPAATPSSSSSGGCAVTADPSKPVPWKSLALGVGVVFVALGRRRRDRNA